MIIVTALDAHEPEMFAAWYLAYVDGGSAGRHAPVVSPKAVLLDHFIQETRAIRRPFGVFEGATCLGAAVITWDTDFNTHVGHIEVLVPPEHRRKGVGSALLERLVQEADEEGLTTLTAEVNAVTPESPGLRFARETGFSTVMTEDAMVLDLPMPVDCVVEQRSFSNAPNLGYTSLSWQNFTPAEHLGLMATLQSAMNVDVPRGEMDYDPSVVTVEKLKEGEARLVRRGYLTFTTMIMSPASEPVGYSRMFIQSSAPEHVLQDDTWVHFEHRGQRIGAWLKAENLALAQSMTPETKFLHTSTAQDNNAMQSLNRRFGFRRTEILHEVQRGGRT